MAKEKRESDLQRNMQEFNKLFPDELSCHRALSLIFQTPNCERCGSDKYTVTQNPRISECDNCGRKRRIYADTVFARVRLVRAWFAGLWLTEKGILFSAYEFAKIFGTALSTAQNIIKTIALFITERMRGLPLVSTAVFLELFCRRSSETPANAHPKEEQLALNKLEHKDSQSNDHLNSLSELEQSIFQCLKIDEFQTLDELIEIIGINFDDLVMGLTSLQFRGLIESRNGQSYKLSETQGIPPSIETIGTSLEQFFQTTKNIWQRISRKYVQMYLALFWNSLTKNWNQSCWFEFCSAEPPNRNLIQSYVSPSKVFVPSAV